jgi:hypothetical protein
MMDKIDGQSMGRKKEEEEEKRGKGRKRKGGGKGKKILQSAYKSRAKRPEVRGNAERSLMDMDGRWIRMPVRHADGYG